MKQYPIRIFRGDNTERPFKISTAMEVMQNVSRNIQKELSFMEQDYAIVIETVKNILALCSKQRDKSSRLYWRIGHELSGFLHRIDNLGFYLLNQNETFARDIGIGKSSVDKIIAFNKRFENIYWVDPSIQWGKYRNNKVPMPEK